MSEILIQNERSKLLANAFDRTSTACITIGVLAPLAALLYGASGTNLNVVAFLLGSVIWLFVAFALHWMARRALGGLRQ